jgi:hypothetical protein
MRLRTGKSKTWAKRRRPATRIVTFSVARTPPFVQPESRYQPPVASYPGFARADAADAARCAGKLIGAIRANATTARRLWPRGD